MMMKSGSVSDLVSLVPDRQHDQTIDDDDDDNE